MCNQKLAEDETALQNYYDLLKVSQNAVTEEIMAAYKNIARNFIIPQGASEGIKNRVENDFAVYQKAYKTLTNELEREKYDLELKLAQLKKQSEELNKPQNSKDNLKQSENTRRVELLGSKLIPKMDSGSSSFTFSKIKIVDIDEKQLKKQRNEKMFEEAKTLIEQADPDRSITLLNILIKANPSESLYHSYLGLAYLKKGMESRAYYEFDIALTLNADEPLARKYCKTVLNTSDIPSLSAQNKKSGNNQGLLAKLLKGWFRQAG